MKKLYLIFTASYIFTNVIFPQADFATLSSANAGSLAEFTSSNLPIIVINTNGQEILDDYKITASSFFI